MRIFCKSRKVGYFVAGILALSPFLGAKSFDLVSSDLSAYRSDVIRKIFDEVHNSPRYGRTIIDLNIGADGKIRTCRIVKSSGDPGLDSQMMQALAKIALPPMKFAGSILDAIQMQICFANAVPDSNNLYVNRDETFNYRNGRGMIVSLSGGTSPGAASENSSQSEKRSEQKSEQKSDQISAEDRTFDREIAELIEGGQLDMTFQSLPFNLNELPSSSAYCAKGDKLLAQGNARTAVNSYIISLVEPVTSGSTDRVQSNIAHVNAACKRLGGEERVAVAKSLLSLHQRLRHSRAMVHSANPQSATALGLLPLAAQHIVDDSSAKDLGKLAAYYQLRGDLFRGQNRLEESKVAYRKYLSLVLEDDSAPPEQVEQAYEKSISALTGPSDGPLRKDIILQWTDWQKRHPEPTNLRAIESCSRLLEVKLSSNPQLTLTSQEIEPDLKKLLELICSSTLYTKPVPQNYLPAYELSNTYTSQGLNERVNHCVQSVAGLANRFRHVNNVEPSLPLERVLRANLKLALKTQCDRNLRILTGLCEYLIKTGKAEEVLAIAAANSTIYDTDLSSITNTRDNPFELLRLKALRSLDRENEALALEKEMRNQKTLRSRSANEARVEKAEARVSASSPGSIAQVQARIAVNNLLLSDSLDNQIDQSRLAKAKTNLLACLRDIKAGRLELVMLIENELNSQLISIVNRSTELDSNFIQQTIEGFFDIIDSPRNKSLRPITRFALVDSVLNTKTYQRNKDAALQLLKNLDNYTKRNRRDDDRTKQYFLSKSASLHKDLEHFVEANKTNRELLLLLEKHHIDDATTLAEQLLRVAISEVQLGDLSSALRHQQRSRTLIRSSEKSAQVKTLLADLAKEYLARKLLIEAKNTYLQIVDLSTDSSHTDTVSVNSLIDACSKLNDYTCAHKFFEEAVDLENKKEPKSIASAMYGIQLADLLLLEHDPKHAAGEPILRRSNELFEKSIDDLATKQGSSSPAIGAAVARHAFLLTLNNCKDAADALLEKYKNAVASSDGGNFIMNTNMGAPPRQ